MGNHTVDCEYCGNDLRATHHTIWCPYTRQEWVRYFMGVPEIKPEFKADAEALTKLHGFY